MSDRRGTGTVLVLVSMAHSDRNHRITAAHR